VEEAILNAVFPFLAVPNNKTRVPILPFEVQTDVSYEDMFVYTPKSSTSIKIARQLVPGA
jgi:hypothetical protein